MPPTPQVIVPVAILEGDVISETLTEFLSTVPVVLLGYHEIPEQTLPDQARDEHGEQASEELAELADSFESHGANVETELVFTHDLPETLQRVVDDVDRGVILRPNPVREIERVVVAVRRADLVPAITATVTALVGPTDAALTLLEEADQEGTEDSGDRFLSGMITTLEEAGIAKQRITLGSGTVEDVESMLLETSSEHDLVILGEDDPGILETIFGTTTEQVAEQTLSPVLVVQQSLDE
ncbi:MAG: universal stress protein [Natronomonas sp.]